jgi:hypothetical protein
MTLSINLISYVLQITGACFTVYMLRKCHGWHTVVGCTKKRSAEYTKTNITLGSALKSWFEWAIAVLSHTYPFFAISCFVKNFGEKLEFFKKFNIFEKLAYELSKRILILKKSDDFFFGFFFFFWKVLDDSLWQVHLRGSNIHFKFYYMFITNEKHHKTQF